MNGSLITLGRALSDFAQQSPDEVVLICSNEDGSDSALTRRELESWSNGVAHNLRDCGIGQGVFVAINYPTCIEHIVATVGVYKAGATPMPVGYRVPAADRARLLELADTKHIFSDDPDLDAISLVDIRDLDDCQADPLPDIASSPSKAVASGGSTGKPKLIVSPSAFQYPRHAHPLAAILRLEPGDLVYSPGPLYHNAPFLISVIALFQGGRVLLNQRFNAGRTLNLIERYKPQVLNVVPTMMQRMLREDDIADRNLSSIRLMWHMASACPAWAKQGFIELLGSEKVLELWAATEFTGITVIDGDEWLTHKGSVGRGIMTEFRILDNDGNELATGDTGEIYSRFAGAPPAYEYLGADPLPQTADGFCSVGDLGYLDEEGYLYLSDRRTDLIISGGSNIYPAEVESVLSEHPAVTDVAVIGLSDSDLGSRVHAIVEPATPHSPPDHNELDAWCRKHLSSYKVPRGYEFLEKLPRNEAGKIRRLALREAREPHAN